MLREFGGMLREFGGGLRMALRRWPRMGALAAMMAASCAVLALLLSDVISQVAVLRGGYQLRAHHAVTFTPYDASPGSGVSQISDRTRDQLKRSVRSGRAYTAVIGNVEVDNPDFAEGTPTIVLFGDAPLMLFPDLRLCAPAPCAMRGAELAGRSFAPLDLGGYRVLVSGVLPPAATFFDAHAAGVQLDRQLILRLPAEALDRMDDIEQEEVAWRVVFLAPSEQEVARYVRSALADGLALVPHDVAVAQPKRFREEMIMSAIYLTGMAAFLALAFVAFASSAQLTLRQEARAFMIRRMYGTSRWRAAVRVGSFLASVMLALPLPMLLGLMVLGLTVLTRPVAQGAEVMVAFVVGAFLLLWARSVHLVTSADLVGR